MAEHDQQTAKRELELQKLVSLPNDTAQQLDEINKRDELISDLKRKLVTSEKSQKQMNEECMRLSEEVFIQSELIKTMGRVGEANTNIENETINRSKLEEIDSLKQNLKKLEIQLRLTEVERDEIKQFNEQKLNKAAETIQEKLRQIYPRFHYKETSAYASGPI